MSRSIPNWRYAAAAVVVIGVAFGSIQAIAASGGYNNMDAKSVYYDNGHDRENAAAMLAAVTGSSSSNYGKYKSGNRRRAGQDVSDSGSHFRSGNITADNGSLRR